MMILFIIPKKSEYPFAIFASLTHVNQLKTRKKMKVGGRDQVQEATHKARLGTLERTQPNSNSPSRVRDQDEGVVGRNEREKYFLTRGH